MNKVVVNITTLGYEGKKIVKTESPLVVSCEPSNGISFHPIITMMTPHNEIVMVSATDLMNALESLMVGSDRDRYL